MPADNLTFAERQHHDAAGFTAGCTVSSGFPEKSPKYECVTALHAYYDFVVVETSSEDLSDLADAQRRKGYSIAITQWPGCEFSIIAKQTTVVLLDLGNRTVCEALQWLRNHTAAAIVGVVTSDAAALMAKDHVGEIDDILFLPLRPAELESRLRIARYRASKRQGEHPLFLAPVAQPDDDRCAKSKPAGDYALALDERQKAFFMYGAEMVLTPKEYELLRLLFLSPLKTYTIEELIENLWVGESRATADDVHQYVFRLRKKLRYRGKTLPLIQTIRGFGYRFANLAVSGDAPREPFP
jgi:DNA-binding response OmpR family regulator